MKIGTYNCLGVQLSSKVKKILSHSFILLTFFSKEIMLNWETTIVIIIII